MSYTRTFSKDIRISYSGTVSYPPSKTGGVRTYSGTATETVHVNIEVDTLPFDESVVDCTHTVNGLTSSVTATEAAQIVAIDKNALKVGSTIINGFFNTIRLEIDQQIMQLNTRIEATLLHLRELGKRCVEKQKQMERDYHNIANRYQKIFNDLNQELSNRIQQLDKPIFLFKQQSDDQQSRTIGNDLASTATGICKRRGGLAGAYQCLYYQKKSFRFFGKSQYFPMETKRLEETIE